MAEISGAQDNVVSNGSKITVVSPPSVPDVTAFPPTTNATRLSQQAIAPGSLQNRFLNLVSQAPVLNNVQSIGIDDVGMTTIFISDGVGSDPPSYAIINFEYVGSTTDFVSVELCTTFFVDAIDYDHIYPTGSAILPMNWTVERVKGAFFKTANSNNTSTFAPNKLNQDFEQLIIKCYESGADHTLFVYYYWRAIINSGGTKV